MKFAAAEKTAFQIAISSALLHMNMWEIIIINNNNKEWNAYYINWIKLCTSKVYFCFVLIYLHGGNKYDR